MEQKGRIKELDGLRGIAILLVLGFHYLNNQLVGNPNWYAKKIAAITSFGWAGVDLFFVLSGFLIGSILIRNKGSVNYFSTFYRRRILRIVPNYFLLVIIFFILCQVPYFNGSDFLTGFRLFPSWTYPLMVQNIFMGVKETMGNPMMSITWSIGVEEQFYLVIPFIVYLLKREWLPYFLVFLIIMSFILRLTFSSWIPQMVLLPCRADALSFGILIAFANETMDLESWFRKNSKYIFAIFLSDIVIVVALYMKYQDLGIYRFSLLAVFFSCLMIFALARNNNIYGEILRSRILVWVGAISYSLYIFHYLILGLFQYVFRNKPYPYIGDGKDIFISAAALFFSLFFSWAVYRKMETPFVTYGKRYKYQE